MRALVVLFVLLSGGFSAAESYDLEAIVSYPIEKEIKEYPADCLFSKAQECVLSTNFHRKFHFNEKNFKLSLGSESSLLRKGATEFHFLKGELWFKGSGSIYTEFGEIHVQDGEFYAKRDKKQVSVRALGGKVLLKARGESQSLFVPNYTENWMGGFRVKDGVAKTGIPQPILIRDHIRKWGQFYSGTRVEFKSEVEIFSRKWAERVHKLSKEYKSMSTRRVANVTNKRKRKKQAKEKRLKEDQVFRDMLRQRALYE